MSTSLLVLLAEAEKSSTILDTAGEMFNEETESLPAWGRENPVDTGHRQFCFTYLRDDGRPSFCDCPRTKAFLLEQFSAFDGSLCLQKACPVRITVRPHHHGGNRRP